MKKEVINILIADDHELIRQGLKTIISFEDNLKIAGQAHNGEELLKLLKLYEADIVLLDFNMPVMNGIETLKRIKEEKPSVKVIMLTVENDRRTIHEAIEIGADGYVLKDSAGTEIVDAINTVCSGEKYIDKSLVSMLFLDIKSKNESKTSVLDKLSKREIEVLLNISKGLSNKEIGESLYISEKTVKNYATNIFKKINVEDRVRATILAIQNNIEDYYKSKFE